MPVEDEGSSIHQPVLLGKVMEALAPRSGGIYVDGTLGLGGHTREILKCSEPDGRVIAFEWDSAALNLSRERLRQYQNRLQIIRSNFAEIKNGLANLEIHQVDGLLIDIGMSSLQLDLGGRGFSFQKDEPLDMRMDDRRELTAAQLLERCSEEELADIFFCYGDEKQARPIAAAIVEFRKREKILRSKQFASLVASAVPKRFHPKRIHMATKVFQALRIAVNGEFENLAKILDEGPQLLGPGAKFCVISFHSLEDRMVKRRFHGHPLLDVLTAQPIQASPEEVLANPRARSARMRVAQRRNN